MYNPNLHFHFTGIGGSGMSGIAEILLGLGFSVSGSDQRESPVTQRLRRLGATVCVGHDAANLPPHSSLLVFSSAIQTDNPELIEARARRIPVIRRAEVLAELMRLKFGVAVAGSHGKTTTTSMVAAVMEAGGLDPTVIIGGQVRSAASGARRGKSEYLVAESDESDRSFLLLKPTVAVVTNIDAEHLTAYSSLHDLEESFGHFVSAVPFYGLAVLCIDDRKVRDLGERYTGRKIWYGLSPDAHIRATRISQDKHLTTCLVLRGEETLFELCLPLPGKHFVTNSLAAVAVGLEFGVEPSTIKGALESFQGVHRRSEEVGIVGGVTVISDYGHHPTEIRATLSAIREGWCHEGRRLHALFQPHRYSRTRDCFVEFLTAFGDADSVIVTDIYSAGEAPLEGISSGALVDAISHPSKACIPSLEMAAEAVVARAQAGDVVVCLGAGSIGGTPSKIIDLLSKRKAA